MRSAFNFATDYSYCTASACIAIHATVLCIERKYLETKRTQVLVVATFKRQKWGKKGERGKR